MSSVVCNFGTDSCDRHSDLPSIEQCASTCSRGTYESTACTSTTNRVCTQCASPCVFGTYESTACTSTTNRVCTLLSNIAMNKPTLQSSTDFAATADRAADGNLQTNFDDGSCSHTFLESDPWWRVDLGAGSRVIAVRVYNRQDCCSERLNDFFVYVGDSASLTPDSVPCAGPVSAPQHFADVQCVGSGRYLHIALKGSNRLLTLCEVQVFEVRSAWQSRCLLLHMQSLY